MSKLCFLINKPHQIALLVGCFSSVLISATFLWYRKKIPLHIQQKNIIQQQSTYIESLYHQLHYLYNGLFELEQLLDDVLEHMHEELDFKYTIEQKARIIKHSKCDAQP